MDRNLIGAAAPDKAWDDLSEDEQRAFAEAFYRELKAGWLASKAKQQDKA